MDRPLLLLAAAALAAGAQTWGLDKIERARVPATGRGVHAYVIDTGVRKSHQDFGGRADWIGDFVGGSPRSGDAEDCDPSPGHGTHVADILAGERFGVATAARVHALRILPCTGTTRTEMEATVRAVDWITAHGQKPAVVNISPARWETADRSLDLAIERSIAAGYVYVLSAGGLPDLARLTPQRVAAAISVAASTDDDKALQRDYGPLLTLFAPGANIEAAGRASDSATFSADGDSYAAPFAAGAAALYLEGHPSATPAEVKRALVDGAVRDRLRDVGSSPNRLLRAIQ
ncbi:MAG TPA: S8 family serine peptidase [Vicinamibacterales bacterium]|nr:S8 family serine peptidase [Vicinamibacterales bacterium]